MKFPVLFILLLLIFMAIGFKEKSGTAAISVIGNGHIPNLAKENNKNIHLVFGSGDSILYTYSADGGQTFKTPSLVGTVSKLYSFAMRGPQIAATANGVAIIACNQQGNIYSYINTSKGGWTKTARVNDADTIAKEGMLALSGDGKNNLFAIWLDIRKGGHNNIYGAKSVDGGKSWSKNKMIYTSPDGHVCECCKPTVAVKGNHVAVMFRNWVNGNRDLYLIESTDGGNTFGKAQKLGNGNWPLNGCPMDGGGITINADNIPQTVWQRKGVIYASEPGKEEKEIGQGRSCTLASAGNKNIYAWEEKGKVICLLPNGNKQTLGEGSLPVLKAINNNEVLCVWQQGDSIQQSLINL